jgi:hypothetical protein
MRFYRCDTTPLTIARTQSDAKATGASFGPWDVDTSHAGLTNAFNQIISEVAATQGGDNTEPGQVKVKGGNSTISLPPRPKPAPDAIPEFAVGAEPYPLRDGSDSKWHGNRRGISEGKQCPACARTWEGAVAMAALENRSQLQELVMGLTDPAHFQMLEEIIAQRRAELAKAQEPVVNPPARRRRA